MTTIHPLPPSPSPTDHRGPSLKLPLLVVAIGGGLGAWTLLDGPQRGVGLGGACLLAGAWLLGPRLREYAGLALVIGGGLLAGVSLLWLLVVAPAVERTEQRLHDLTHPSISVPSLDVGGAADKARDVVAGLTGGRR